MIIFHFWHIFAIYDLINLKMVQAGGLEPPAYFLGGSRSILMSYACTKNLLNTFYNDCQSV